jgi:hypothetical protein
MKAPSEESPTSKPQCDRFVLVKSREYVEPDSDTRKLFARPPCGSRGSPRGNRNEILLRLEVPPTGTPATGGPPYKSSVTVSALHKPTVVFVISFGRRVMCRAVLVATDAERSLSPLTEEKL